MRRTLIFSITLIVSLCFCINIEAQIKSISGRVIDTDGYALPGVNVIVKGTTVGTITDADGNYSLKNVPLKSILEFSFVGMDTKEIIFNGKSPINVTLSSSSIALNEVVAIGYEVKKKSVVTGAISSLNADELLKAKPANAVSALSGRVSGVNVMVPSGQPGSSPKLVIRGIGTNGDSNPLYVIDGLPMSDMNSVNPNDIESMEVLKDATSTAIYGARGANGVVLITTKRAQKGNSSVSYNGYFGWSSVQKTPNLLNTDQYIDIMKEFYSNDNTDYPADMPTENKGIDTDWMDVIFSTAPVTEHNVTAMMGSDKGSSLLSLGYLDQNGIMGGNQSFFKRYSVRLNSQYDVNKFLSVGANLNYNYINKNGVSSGSNGWNPMQYAYLMDPTCPVYDSENGDDFGYGVSQVNFTRMFNPLCFTRISTNAYDHTQRFFGNAFAQITFIKNLVFKSDVGVNISNHQRRSYMPIYTHGQNFNKNNSVDQSSDNSSFWQWENTLRYQFSIGKHNASVLLGTTASRNNYEYLKGNRKNLPDEALNNDNYWYLDAGDVMTATNNGGANAEHSLFSTFGRLSYNYAEKYMAEFVIRRDGSSNFGPNNRYATFPGVSLGWNVSNEKFWNVKNFDSLKLRLSWGQNGNESISPFSYTSVIGNQYSYNLNGNIYPGSAPNSLVNPDVKWETSEQYNVGADMMFFKGKLRGSFDVYQKDTKDLLFRPTVEAVRGNQAAFNNVGQIRNSGFEVQATYSNNYKDFTYSVSANASYLKNKVITVGNTNGYVEGGDWQKIYNVTRMQEGKPMGYYYLYKTLGIFQNKEQINNYKYKDGTLIQPNAKPGDFIFQDTDGKDGITNADRTDCGNPWPKWTLGANISLGWKNFDFSMFLTSKLDYKLYSAQYRSEGYGRSNLPTFFLDRWQKEGDNKGVPRLSLKDENGSLKLPSDFYLTNASFLKISSMEIGYTIPASLLHKINITKARFYVAMDNVATFTDYPYVDPEVGIVDGDILNTGMDYGMYPQARTTRVGLSVTF